MGVKYDHLEDTADTTKSSDKYFGLSFKFSSPDDSDIDLQDTSDMPQTLESAIRILRKQIKEASSEILLMKKRIDSLRH
jgi:hypothetical protein